MFSLPLLPPPPHQASPLPGASSLSRVRCIFSHWGQARQFSAVYVLEALDQLVYAAWLLGQCLRDLRGIGATSTPVVTCFDRFRNLEVIPRLRVSQKLSLLGLWHPIASVCFLSVLFCFRCLQAMTCQIPTQDWTLHFLALTNVPEPTLGFEFGKNVAYSVTLRIASSIIREIVKEIRLYYLLHKVRNLRVSLAT